MPAASGNVYAVWHKPSRRWIGRNVEAGPFPQLFNREEAESILKQIRERAASTPWSAWYPSDRFDYDIMTWPLPDDL